MADPFLAPTSTTIDEFVVRSWQPGDGATLAATTSASYDHLSPWMDWAVPDDPPGEAEERVRLFAGKYLAHEDFVLSVWDGEVLVGATGFHPRWGGLESRVAEIGMWIAADDAGRGIGTTILRGMVRWGLSDAWCWDRLVWLCDGRNVASAKVAQKAGFTLEGNLRGPDPQGHGRDSTLVWGFNRDDPDPDARGERRG